MDAMERRDDVRADVRDLVRRLRELFGGPVKVMPEGWTGWMDRGYPYE